MKKYILISVFSLAALISFITNANAQNNNYIFRSDTLQAGKYYVVKTTDGGETVGMLVSADETSITLSFEGDRETILKRDISEIHTSISGDWKFNRPLLQLKRKTSFYFGAGIAFPTDENSHYSTYYAKGIEIFAGKFLSSGKSVGFNAEIHFHHLARKDDIGPDYSSTGGDINTFGLRMKFLTGDLDPKDVNYHFLAGIEIGAYFRSERHDTYNSPNYPLYEFTYGGTSSLYAGITAGLNVNFLVTEKIRLFIEPQFNLILGVSNPNYYSLNAGIIL